MDAETRTPLELATVSVLGPDSSLVTYRLSDKTGRFTIEKLPLKKKLLINVTYTGYAGYHKTVQLAGGHTDTLTVLLKLNNSDAQAVVVTATAPIRMNGDTLELNPAGFKLKEGAVVEELLNQVSGITIWSDGSITVNGKKVSSLLVDGKPFMGSSDSRLATQNLPKSAIDKIQLYQEYDRANIGQDQPPKDSLLTMNIKLKESAKKGYFGKAGAGYGTTDRFESDLSFQVYNKNSSVGIGGGFNNINKSIGNLQELFQNNTFRNLNPNLYYVGRFGASGINKSHSIGGVYTHSFIETANSRQNNRVVINYNKSGTDASVSDMALSTRTAADHPQVIRDEGVQHNRQDRHDLGFNYVKTNSYNDNLNLNGSVSSSNESGTSSRTSEVRDTANQLQSTNKTAGQQSRRGDNESLSGSFAKSNSEDPLKNFNLQFNARRGNSVSERDMTSVFLSATDARKSTSYNRHYSVDNQSLNIGGSLNYAGFKRMLLGRYNLFGIDLSFTQALNYTRSRDNNRVADYDSSAKQYIANGNLTNYHQRAQFEYTPALGLSKGFFKYSDVFYRNIYVQARFLDELKTDNNRSSFAKRNLDRSFQFFRYEGNLSYNYQRREHWMMYLSANYAKNFEYPSIDQLYTIVDDINVYNIRVGNPSLQNRVIHNLYLNASFNTQNPKAVYTVNSSLGGNFSRSLHPVTDSIINDLSGKRTVYATNADKSGNMGVNYNFNISRKFNKNNLQLMFNGQYSTGEVPNYIDGVYNISETGNLYNAASLQYTLGALLVVNAGQTFQRYQTRQTAKGFTSFTNSSTTSRVGVVLNFPKNVTFSSTADRVSNANLAKPTVLWNAFATYRFLKQQGELKFSAMDLLKQYQNITNSVYSYGTTTRITNGLQQYFLLTFSYYPRKFGKTEIKKQGAN